MLDTTFTRFGLQLNYKTNKSGAVSKMSGPGTATALEALAIDQDGFITFGKQSQFRLACVTAYQHMGGRHCQQCHDVRSPKEGQRREGGQ